MDTYSVRWVKFFCFFLFKTTSQVQCSSRGHNRTGI